MPHSSIREQYDHSIEQPNKFWLSAAKQVDWFSFPTMACQNNTLPVTGDWFKDGIINSCYNALDIHVENGFGEQAAIIYESPVTQNSETISYLDLLQKVSVFAGALKHNGLVVGDTVVLYMPMIPEAIIAMLACARIGVIHSVVFGGFAANELAVRIDDAKPKVIISASCGIEGSKLIDYKKLLDEAIQLADHKPNFQVIHQRPQKTAICDVSNDIQWIDFIDGASAVDCVPLTATAPLYILYTSGTTGKPKGVIRDNGGHCVALKWSMQNIYNVAEGDVYWAASDIGWVVGHSYIVYGPLFNRNTTILYEGKPVGTPDAAAFWRVIDKHKVNVLFTAPTAIRAIKREDPQGDLLQSDNFDLSSLKALFLAGERSDPDTLRWAENQLHVPVIDHWWQTETGWAICANCLGIEAVPVIHGSPTLPVPGYQVFVLDKKGEIVTDNSVGALVIKTPLPPGTFTGLWNDNERFQDSYFKKYNGYYETGDAGYIDENGYVFVMARTDDIINVAGHRLSTGSIEEVISNHIDVAECAVIGIPDQLKGEVPLALLVLNKIPSSSDEIIQSETIQMVREQLGAVYSYKTSVIISTLPKTRSGKVLRSTMRKIAKHEPYVIPATIDDPKILKKIEEALQLF